MLPHRRSTVNVAPVPVPATAAAIARAVTTAVRCAGHGVREAGV